MHRRLTALLFSIFICVSITAQQIYYIDPNGNDSTGDGSSTAPWKTLYKACSSATSGSTIHVNPGTYYENAECHLPIGVNIVGEGTSTVITSSSLTA
ncbi:MAG: DUF1565 domain-containing protein, partial [Bacteroidales bacterium]|nr:DUF1565 domain-containing protein [Bacteroidales bacterium]